MWQEAWCLVYALITFGWIYGPVALNATNQQMVTPTNTGQVAITGWAGGAVPAPFNSSQDCNVQGGLLPGKSCHFYYTFTPTTPGPFSATSSFSTNAGSFNVKLQGRADAPYNIWVPALRR
jgi:hypothetical protein